MQVNPIIKKGLQDKALALILSGKRNVDIIAELGVPRKAFYAWKKTLSKGDEMGTIRQQVRLEISQEKALSELATQLKQYTDNYELAMKAGKTSEAYSWSSRRVDLLEKMLKVTGLYDANTRLDKELPPQSIQDDVALLSDEELIRRATDIITRIGSNPK